MKTRNFFHCFILLIACVACSKKEPAIQQIHIQGETMGTYYSVKFLEPNQGLDNGSLKVEIDNRLKQINQSMSTYIPESELSLLNTESSTEPIKVSEELFSVILFAQSISELSNGAFDITVGPLVNLWGFGPDKKNLSIPDNEIILTTLAKTGYKKLLLDKKTSTIRKTVKELYIDLSAIAKGYAVDQIAKLLETKQITNYMVEIGGEVKAAGKNKTGKPWQIGIEKPKVGERAVQRVIALNNQAMASSGNYRNFHEIDGTQYSHTIDPNTGKPVTHKLASVTVITKDTIAADAWATALMVLGSEQGLKIAEQNNIAAMFILHPAKGQTDFIEIFTSGFPK